MLIIIITFALTFLAHSNNITSNIPVVVTSNKNYSSSQPTWVTSPYFRAGYQAVISSFTGSSQYPFASYTFTFSSALPGVPNLAYGIKKYRGNDYFGQQFYQIRKTGLTAGTFSVQIQIFGWTNLWVLEVSYIAIDPTFPHHLNSFDNIPLNYSAGNIVNISVRSHSLQYYTNYINYTAETAGRSFTTFTTPFSSNYIVLYITSLWIKGNSAYPVQFHITPSVVNSSFYMWNATVYRQITLTNVHFSLVVFNSDDVESSKKYFIVLQKWYNDMEGGFLALPIEFVDNFIMGLTSFEAVKGNCGHEYQWEFINKTVDGVETFGANMLRSWHINDRCGLSWTQSSIFYMMTWQCDPPYYYFNLSSGMCQTLCGGFNIENPSAYTCDPCLNDKCYQCDTNTTYQCSECATYLFYELSTGQCVCTARYFPANESCLSCDFGSTGCINCTYDDGSQGSLAYDSSLFVCTQCNNTNNYFLTGSQCTLCTLNFCANCQNLTHCAVCNPDYDYSDAQTCMKCLVTGCKNCSASNDNICTTCDNSIGYYNDNSNNKCKTQCGDNIFVAATEQCDDGNNVDYDGCSSTCQTEPSVSCSGSPSACIYQTSVDVVLNSQSIEVQACNTITFKFDIIPPSDTFAQSYVNWEGFLVTPNQSALQVNNTMFSYSSGIFSASYFMLNHLQNKTVIFDTNFSSLIKNSTLFTNTTSPTISFTVDTVPEAIMGCCDGYYLAFNPTRCADICGDGRVYQLPCDDGNLLDKDGCSSICQIQSGYACMNHSDTNPSICSYNQTFAVALKTGQKSPTSNSLALTYSLSPAQPWNIMNNGSNDVTDLVSFPGSSGVTVKSATIDPVTNQLTVDIDFSQDLQGKDLNLQLTPPDTPQASLTPTATNTWQVYPTNHLAAIAYSDQDYEAIDKVTPFANTLLGFYLATAFMTMFFRKWIGLELACIIQLGYLSLLQNPSKSVYIMPVSTWSAVFGYNGLHYSPVPDQKVQLPYSFYGYQIYFGFSNNVMVIIAACMYGLAAAFFLLSHLISSRYKQKCKKIASFILHEICYSLIVFTTPNVVTAICIQASQSTILDTSLLWSKVFFIGAVTMLVAVHIVSIVHIKESSDVGTFFRKHSNMGIYAPIFFNTRLIAVTILLFSFHFSKTVPSYSICILQIGYVLFILFGKPHKKPLDYGRSLCIEIGLLYILVMRYLQVQVLSQYLPSKDIAFPVVAYLEYALYGLAIVVSLCSFGYHIGKACSHKKVEPKSQQSPEKNQSMAKIQPDSKRSKGQDNPLIFNVEDVDFEGPPTSKASTFDVKKKERKTRSRRR